MKQLRILFMLLVLFCIPSSLSHAWNSFRNEDGLHNANITTAQTPTTPENTYIKWQKRFSETTGTSCNSSPIITDTTLYVVCEDVLYELDKQGSILRSLSLCNSMNSVCRMTLHEDSLYIPLRNGTMECVNIHTMTSQWISESFENQSLSTVLFHNGYVYAGTTHPTGSEGVYYCLDAENGSTVWTYSNTETPCGFYWSGACAFSSETQTGILFGGDNGILVSHSATDESIFDTLDLSQFASSQGKIRAGITYDETTNCYYTTSTNGYLYKIHLLEDGTFGETTSVFLGEAPTDSINCTSTPTIHNGRIYVGSFYGTNGRLYVIDANTMTPIYWATNSACGDIKSSPLLSIGYATAENSEKVYVYVTHNAFSGGLYYIEDTIATTQSELKPLITPTEGKQFCMSSVAVDNEGTLYYSNDSGYLFAVSIGTPPTPTPIASPNVTPSTTGTPSTTVPTPAPKKEGKTKAKKPGKPTKITYTAKKKRNGKYKVTLRWKKGALAQKTCVYIKGKKKRFFSGKKAIFTLKKGTYTIRFTSHGTGKNTSKTVKKVIKIR